METRNGGDREKSTTGDSAKSMDLQQIQDEMELTKHNYEKLARSERAATAKFDSIEKKIESMGEESNARFGALEQKMTVIMDMLTRFEETAMFNQRPGKEIALASQPPVDQVPISLSQPEQSPTQLGYRRIQDTIANRDKMLRKIEMPVFSGPLPFDWISRVERFFR